MKHDFRQRQMAFTMSEMMVVIAIIGVLAGIAAPSIGSMIASTRLSTASSSLVAAVALARAEAGRRGVRVTICPGSVDSSTKQVVTTNNACKTSAGATLWNDAYLVFAETKSGGTLGQYEAGDTLLRAETFAPGISITPSFTDLSISVLPSGGVSVGGTFLTCLSGLQGREITIKRTGNASSKVSTTVCP